MWTLPHFQRIYKLHECYGFVRILWQDLKSLLPILASRQASSLASNSASMFPLWYLYFRQWIVQYSLQLLPITVFFYLVCEAICIAATPGLLCQPRVIVKMILEKQMECRLAGETGALGENLPQRHFCPSQNPMPITVTSPYMTVTSTSRTLESWVPISLGAWLRTCIFPVFVLSCISALVTGRSPVRGALVNVYK
jgi:hypothetical protein